MKKIDIYYSSACTLCTKAIEFFHQRGVTFTAHAVEWDDAADTFVDSKTARTMFQRCGTEVDFVPQIFIDERHLGGWRKLEPMIASGEIESLL